MAEKESSIPQSKLLCRTLELLRNRPKPLTLAQIEADTGLTQDWLWSIVQNRDINPTINRVEHLYCYLTGKQLKI